jgi:hypothetical protein
MYDTPVRRTCFSHSFGTHPSPAGPKELFGLVTVVRSAAKLDVVHRGSTTYGIGNKMMEFQEGALAAPPAVRADECAASAVSNECTPLHLGRDVPRVVRLTAAGTGPAGHGELLVDQRVDQRIERAPEDLCDVSARDCVTEQILRKLELLAHLRIRGKGDPIPVRGKRLDHRPRRLWNPRMRSGLAR